MFEVYQINAFGRSNCKVAEECTNRLARYIFIDSVEASRENNEPKLLIRFTRNKLFKEVFYEKR